MKLYVAKDDDGTVFIYNHNHLDLYNGRYSYNEDCFEIPGGLIPELKHRDGAVEIKIEVVE